MSEKFNIQDFLSKNKITKASKLIKEDKEDVSEDLSQSAFAEDITFEMDYEDEDPMEGDMAGEEGDYEDEMPAEEEPEVEESGFDYSQYESIEELINYVERSTNEAALKHKMKKYKEAYAALEETAASLEEGEHSQYISKTKLKGIKRDVKELRKMHEKCSKEYEKKYSN